MDKMMISSTSNFAFQYKVPRLLKNRDPNETDFLPILQLPCYHVNI